MGFWSDLGSSISSAFSGGGSSSSSSSGGGYEEAAYGGTDYRGQSPSTPQQRASYATGSDGNYITDSRGNRIETPQSRQNYEEQQAEVRRQQVAAAAEAERQRKLEEARQAQMSIADRYLGDFLNPAEVDLNILEQAGYLDQGGLLYNEANRSALANYAALNVGQDLASAADVAEYYGQTGDSNITNVDLDQYNLLGSTYGKENIGVFDDKMYVVNPPSFATAVNQVGQMVANKIAGPLAGGFAGDLAFALGGSDLGAVEGALYADAATQGITSFGLGKIFENANILMDASGNYFVNDTLTNPFTGEFTNNIVSLEDKTAQTIAFNEAQQANQSSDDYDTSKVANIISNSTGNTINWRDYRGETFSLSPQEIVNAAIGGVNFDPEVVDAAKFAANLAGGVDPLQAALNVYGDNLTSKLPEGYQRPTEAAVRIGLGGENRVAVLGDIYGEDFNLDNPLGKAGLKGAEVYDITGDSKEALQKSVYTYFKEGGKLPDFEAPEFLSGSMEGIELPSLDINFDWLKEAGMNVRDMFAFDVPLPSLNLNWSQLTGDGIKFGELPDLGFEVSDLKNIDFGGVKLGDIEGLNLGNLKEYGLEVGDLPDMNIDIDFELGALRKRTGQFIEEEEQFEAIDEEEALADAERSLARELLGMEQTKAVQEKA